MKKTLLLTALLLSGATVAQAQLTVHNFQDETWVDSWETEYSAMGNFFHVSANGAYAVGYDDQEQSAAQGGAFLWRRDDPGVLEFINTTDNRISACDVTNAGVIVGSFENRGEDGEATICYPGWRTTDEVWHQLPVPEKYSEKNAKSYDFMEEARAVTPDGKYIAGNVHITVGTKEMPDQGMVLEVVKLTPVLWEQNAEGGYDLKQTYLGLGDAGKSYTLKDGELVPCEDEVNYKQFLVYDISNDGSTICGVNTADNGGQNPAIIRNGVLIQPFLCDAPTEESEYGNFNGGIINSIDAQGNAYGYYQEEDNSTKNFVFTPDNKIVYYDGALVTCATKDGERITQSSNGVSYVFDCSEDGNVVAGCGLGAWEMGTYTYPVLASNDEVPPSGIKEIKANVGVDYRANGKLYVNGAYDKAVIYNAAGQVVASGKQGVAFNLGHEPAGTYIVNVTTANGTQSFKVAK